MRKQQDFSGSFDQSMKKKSQNPVRFDENNQVVHDELEHVVYVQRIRRVSFPIALFMVSLAFVAIALVSDQINQFTTTELNSDGEEVDSFTFCGFSTLYSNEPISINPDLTLGLRTSWRYEHANQHCLPISSQTQPEATIVCESLEKMQDAVRQYFIFVMACLVITLINVAVHIYQLHGEMEHWKKLRYDTETEPLRNRGCAGRKIYWIEAFLAILSFTCCVLGPVLHVLDNDSLYCTNAEHTGRCSGPKRLNLLKCEWSIGASDFHLFLAAFFQFVGVFIKLKQLFCTNIVSYKSRLTEYGVIGAGEGSRERDESP